MEPQQQLLQQNSQLEKINTSNYLCRQSSTRWTPTTEQIKLLKELYYINGVRSPTADQIQAICARLRRYGKIEGKNVFYWFQNHKARERQKKRLIPTANNNNNNNNNLITNPAPQFHNNISTNNNGGVNCWKQDEITKYPYINSNNNPGISCSSSAAGVVPGGGQLMGSFGYGTVNMENKFRDCSISGGGVFNATGNMNNSNFSYAAATTYYSNFHDKFSTFDEDHEQDHYVASPEIETLPLFPMHNENLNHDHHFPSTGYYTGGYPWSNGGSNGASLELSLNSYGYGCYSHNY